MRKLVLTAAAALAMTLPSLASAQAAFTGGVVDFNGDVAPNGSIGGYQVGPYQATLSGFAGSPFSSINGTNLTIWCVDFSHVANPDADSYTATRLFGTNTNMSETRLNDMNRYRQFAYLIERYNAGVAMYTAGNVQGTIWQNVGSGISAASNGTDAFDSQLSLPTGTFDLSRDWYVLSDCLGGTGCDSNQEYLVSVARTTTAPEPSTYALMAAGLAGLGFASRRRRKLALA